MNVIQNGNKSMNFQGLSTFNYNLNQVKQLISTTFKQDASNFFSNTPS